MTIGQKLKQKRIESGKSLEQISALTKIHIKILRAIEEDRYSELPAKAFTRGFIVNYAKALKLDSDALLFEHQEFLETRFGERQARDQGHHGYAFEGKELEQNKRWTWIALVMAGGFTLAVVLVFKPGNHRSKEKHKEYALEDAAPSPSEFSPAIEALNPAPIQSEVEATASPAPTTPTPGASPAMPAVTSKPSASPTTIPDAPLQPSPSPDKLNKGDDLTAQEAKIKLVIIATEDAWTRYKADEKPVGMLILRAGKTLVIKAKNRILFESNPSAKLQFKTRKTPLSELSSLMFEMQKEGEVNPYSGNEMGGRPLSDTIPPPRVQ
ncbi:MAG: helix-turn-helix domain-containing protein [Bdellovibrionales bacterium]|nr:helix-turn-helix domain-containing protein [Bdellovibrionales bacterium]